MTTMTTAVTEATGIPTGIHPKEGRSAAAARYTALFCSSKAVRPATLRSTLSGKDAG